MAALLASRRWCREDWRVSALAPAYEGAGAYRRDIDRLVEHCAAVQAALGARESADEAIRNLPRGGQRHEIAAALKAGARLRGLESDGSCRYCFLSPCICAAIETVPALRHRVWLLLHHTEVFRRTNTGKLLALACPGARLAVAGVPALEAPLLELMAQARPTTVVLYPGPGCIGTAELLAALRTNARPVHGAASGAARARARASPPHGAVLPALDIVLLDATWTCAKSLVRRLPPDARFVRINTAAGGARSLFATRHQGEARGEAGLVSTAEACAALLDELGEPHELGAALRDNFRLSEDTVLLQSRGMHRQRFGSWTKLTPRARAAHQGQSGPGGAPARHSSSDDGRGVESGGGAPGNVDTDDGAPPAEDGCAAHARTSSSPCSRPRGTDPRADGGRSSGAHVSEHQQQQPGSSGADADARPPLCLAAPCNAANRDGRLVLVAAHAGGRIDEDDDALVLLDSE